MLLSERLALSVGQLAPLVYLLKVPEMRRMPSEPGDTAPAVPTRPGRGCLRRQSDRARYLPRVARQFCSGS
jgi:hypothetical protein